MEFFKNYLQAEIHKSARFGRTFALLDFRITNIEDLRQTHEPAALREIARLEGVVRTKTAEGKAQAMVVAVMPFPLIGLLNYLNLFVHLQTRTGRSQELYQKWVGGTMPDLTVKGIYR